MEDGFNYDGMCTEQIWTIRFEVNYVRNHCQSTELV